MSNDNKTLADVQPGGRVRLGDQAATYDQQTIERVAKAMQASEQAQSGWAWADCSPIEVEGWMDLARAAVAALSAQPSPVDQNALVTALEVFERRRTDIPYEVYEQVKAVCAALAARQPVGEPVAYGVPDGKGGVKFGKGWAFTKQAEQSLDATMPLYAAPPAQCAGEPVAWMTHHDEPMLFPTSAEAAAYCEDDEQPVPLFRSPAQAVELGQFRPAVELMEWQERGHANPDFPSGDAKKHAEALRLLALIDSQAVGNG